MGFINFYRGNKVFVLKLCEKSKLVRSDKASDLVAPETSKFLSTEAGTELEVEVFNSGNYPRNMKEDFAFREQLTGTVGAISALGGMGVRVINPLELPGPESRI